MKRDILIVTFLSSLFFLTGNWILSITSPDEGKNLDAALRMLETHNFVVPYYNCEYRFEKPPLLYWFTDLSFFLFGVNEFSSRLVSGLSAVGLAIITYLIGRILVERESALKGAIVYVTLIHNWVEARAAVPEMLLTFFMTLGLYLLLKERFLLGWFSLGLAFLAKGPVGVILPCAVYLLWKRSFKFLKPAGLFLFLIVGFSWYTMMINEFGFQYFYKFFIYENILRFTGHKSIHPYPFWYYIPIIAASSIFYLPRIPTLVRRWNRKLNPLSLWFLFVLLFYSVAKNKLHHYVLFLYPPLALILGMYVGRRYLKGVLLISSVLIAFLLFYLGKLEEERFVPKAVEIIKEMPEKEIYFYRTENSAIVFYTRRCIEKLENVDVPKKGILVITEEKYVVDFHKARILLDRKEFGKRLTLLELP